MPHPAPRYLLDVWNLVDLGALLLIIALGVLRVVSMAVDDPIMSGMWVQVTSTACCCVEACVRVRARARVRGRCTDSWCPSHRATPS